ncbi:MAG: DUF3108 domain-containing protein [Gemmatimonadaceae bacterium]|nr:DUF3108 domain-containing protein [Gemmatimonadaceae bacterium]
MPAPHPRSAPDQPASPPRASMLRAVAGTGLRLLAMLVVSVLVLPYVVVPAYDYHAPSPFQGATLFNPYAASSPQARWQRANFHAHSRAWGGLTSGRQAPDTVRAAYVARGYDVIGLSNYHTITRAVGDPAFLPVYEHGFSIRKTHQLIIGARAVVGLDFPLYQTSAAKQYLLTRLRDTAALTAVVHPYLRMGYDTTELARLSGFDLLEVRSHWNDASAWWDAVLTAGNPVWAIGDDDVHDVTRPQETGVVWTMVHAPTRSARDVIAALRAGRMYVVAGGVNGPPAPALAGVEVQGDTITTRFETPVDRIRVIADGGVVRADSDGTAAMRYVMRPGDHYARVVATRGEQALYLNPVIRAAGAAAPQPWTVPPVRPLAAITARAAAALAWTLAMVLLVPGVVRRLRARRTERLNPRSMPTLPRTAASLLALLTLTGAASAGAQSTAASALPFRNGEYHEYDLKFGVVQVGSGSLSVTGPDTLRGREVMKLRYEIRGGIPLFRVHDVMESWFDPAQMLSLRFTQDLNEGPKHYTRFFDFYPDEQVVLERGKPRAATVSAPLDDAAFIFYVRTLKLEVGQTLTFNRYFRPSANPVTIQVMRRESITVPAGTFNTIVVRPIIRTSGIFSEGGQAELWFSDDPAHTLIQMKAKLSFGSLSLYLRPSRNRR